MTTFVLPETLDLRAASALKAALAERRGSDLTLNAADVQRLGGLCLQILLAADAAWRRDGFKLTIEAPSEAFTENASLMAAVTMLTFAEAA
ncbi:MAG: STAS domain-containing protein [Caulobacterales bacterium]